MVRYRIHIGSGSAAGGAGSGHLEYRSLQVTPGTLLTARVGRGGAYYEDQAAEASSLAISGGELVTAQPGDDGHYSDGDHNDDDDDDWRSPASTPFAY